MALSQWRRSRFLALALAQQHLHWLPAALRLARKPGVRVTEVGLAIERAAALQPGFEQLQREAIAASLDPSPEPASERQARAILEFVRSR